MKYSEAQVEFANRLSQWAAQAFEEEMMESFPSFRFCSEWSTRTCLFLKSLDHQSQIALGKALRQARQATLGNSHSEVVSDEVADLLRREEAFRQRTAPGTWEGRWTPEVGSEKRPLANRRLLKDSIKRHFMNSFSPQFAPLKRTTGRTDLSFESVCRGWVVETSFEFGRWDPEISHSHRIWNGKWITKEEPAVMTYNCIGFRLSYGNEIGIGSVWDSISIENIDPVCLEVIEHCRRM